MTEHQRHPFLYGLSKHRGSPPTLLVIFGASGDLTQRKLIPALFNLAVDQLLPSCFSLVGFGRKAIADEEFKKIAEEAVAQFSRRPLTKEAWESLSSSISYHTGDYSDPAAYTALAQRIEETQKRFGRTMQLLFYISTPPNVFEDILKHLGGSGLAAHNKNTPLCSKVIIEKPFGTDLETAKQLNNTLRKQFDEEQVYRIDHYLGKETVQDLLVQRFANSIFEPIWNREYVSCVQITVAESIGVGSRAGYYDQSGALRDMIQNHAMQLLALTAMEPPASLAPESIRDEKVKLLKAVQPLVLKPEGGDVVRGQYGEGLVDGKKVPAYLSEASVHPDSSTETFVALRCHINNWRWQGVPFYIRSGKRLARRVSEIVVQFKKPPGVLFTEGNRFDVASNTLVMHIQPDEGISLLINSKIPGLETRTQPVRMHFRYATTYGSNTPEAYERLIIDAMIGDSTLFIRGDETETSWQLCDPILSFWKEQGHSGLEPYVSGSWGCLAADRLLWENFHTWRIAGS